LPSLRPRTASGSPWTRATPTSCNPSSAASP
jgi:hypothetical protein